MHREMARQEHLFINLVHPREGVADGSFCLVVNNTGCWLDPSQNHDATCSNVPIREYASCCSKNCCVITAVSASAFKT